jgi:glucose/arabinose dehydrogenase
MHGDDPSTPVDWSNPEAQWQPVVTGFQQWDGMRVGRPTGIAVGPDGSLFIADDAANVVYRVRPN